MQRCEYKNAALSIFCAVHGLIGMMDVWARFLPSVSSCMCTRHCVLVEL